MITITLTLICLFIVILFFMYVYLIVTKWRRKRIDKKKARWIQKHERAILSYLSSGDFEKVTFAPKKSYEYESLKNYFSSYMANFKLDDKNDPIRAFAERYFLRSYSKQLRARKWSKRMNTLYFIDLFQPRGMIDELIQRLTEKDVTKEERLLIYTILANMGYVEIDTLMDEEDDVPSFLIHVILNRLIDEHNIDSYIDRFDQLHFSWKLAVLDLIRDKHLRSWRIIELLERLLQSSEKELRIRALKTIANVGYITTTDVIFSWYKKESKRIDWLLPTSIDERMMAARVMGMIKDERWIPLLEQLISDPAYRVRAEAAKALRKYKDGKTILERIAKHHNDPYAQQIAAEWLGRNVDYD